MSDSLPIRGIMWVGARLPRLPRWFLTVLYATLGASMAFYSLFYLGPFGGPLFHGFAVGTGFCLFLDLVSKHVR